jgi:hypothetical protein
MAAAPRVSLNKCIAAASARVRRRIEALGPYQSLFLLIVPTSLIEPLKLIAVYVAGEGHWVTGTAMIVLAYCGSLLLLHRLFGIVKPKLLTLPWFAKVWGWLGKLKKALGFRCENHSDASDPADAGCPRQIACSDGTERKYRAKEIE